MQALAVAKTSLPLKTSLGMAFTSALVRNRDIIDLVDIDIDSGVLVVYSEMGCCNLDGSKISMLCSYAGRSWGKTDFTTLHSGFSGHRIV
jgi:hypothetical protein